MSKGRSLALVMLAYVIAVAVGIGWLCWGPRTGRLWLDTLIADLLATGVVFVFSRAYRNSSFYDAYWSVIPPLLAFYWWSQGPMGPGSGDSSGTNSLRIWLLAAVMTFWAVRLTANWAHLFSGLNHEDWRYPILRDGAGRFEFLADLFGIHLFPTLQVFVGMLPVYVALTRPGDGLVWLTWVAFAVGIAAVSVELIADRQMQRFVASAGPGSPAHLAGELLNVMAGIKLVHVAYKGTAQANTDALKGVIQLTIAAPISLVGLIKSGKMKALGITSSKRSSQLPDVPAIAETVPGYEYMLWNGIEAPAATPRPVIARLNAALNKGISSPDMKDKLSKAGVDIDPQSPEQMAAYIDVEMKKLARVIREAGIKGER